MSHICQMSKKNLTFVNKTDSVQSSGAPTGNVDEGAVRMLDGQDFANDASI